MFNPLKSPKVETHTIDNGDTVTTVTVTYNRNGTKSIKKQTSPKHIPENDIRYQKWKGARKGSLEEVREQVKHDLKKVLGVGHADDAKFANKVNRAIPAEIVLIASQDDVTQAQESDSALRKYGLPTIPNTQSTAGSLSTSALLQLLFEDPNRVLKGHSNPYDCRQLLKQIQARVKQCSSLQEANPVISSSRPLGPPALKKGEYAPFYIVPPGFNGTRRALLICVVNGKGEDLKGPPNDINYIHYFLTKHCGFKDKDIVQLRDDRHAPSASKRSTKQNILDGFSQMVKLSKPNDVVFIQFSGHGGRLGDSLYLLPSDFKKVGQIMDDQILQDLIKYMPAKTHTTMLVDCCYSGVIGDLPYTLLSKAKKGAKNKEDDTMEQEIATYYDTNTRQEMMEKEKWGDDEYKEKKSARSKWRNITRIASVAQEYAEKWAKDAAVAAGQAATAAGKAANEARDSFRGNDSFRGGSGHNKSIASEAKPSPAKQKPVKSSPSSSKDKPQAAKPAPVRARSQSTTAIPGSGQTKPNNNKEKPQAAKPTPPVRAPSQSSQNSVGSGGSGHSRASNASEKPKPGKRAQPPVTRPSIKKPPLRRVSTAPLPSSNDRFARPKTNDEMARQRKMAASNNNNSNNHGEDEIEITSRLPSRNRSMNDYEEEARKDAVLRSQQEAAQARAQKAEARRRALERSRAAAKARKAKEKTRMKPEEARAKMDNREYDWWTEAARREAVEKSRREAAEARDALNEKEYKEWMEAARREAVERSRREAAEARATMSKKEYDEWMEQARREAVERSHQEAELARSTLDWQEYEDWIEAARKEAVAKSRKEAAEARSESTRAQEYEEYMNEARRQAIERSQREAALEHEEAARRSAVGRRESLLSAGGTDVPRSIEEEAMEHEEAARRSAVGKRESLLSAGGVDVPRSVEEAALSHEEAARKAAVGKRESLLSAGGIDVPRSVEEAALNHEEAARKAAVGKRESLNQATGKAIGKTPPRRSKSIEQVALEHEEAARKAIIGKRENPYFK